MADCLAKILIFTVALLLWVCGILLIIFGAIALADPDTIISILALIDGVDYVTDIFDVMPLLEGVAIFMIVLGCFLFLVGGIGFGIICSRKAGIGYIVAMTCAILTEIALIIYAAVYPGTMTDWVEQQMADTLPVFESVSIDLHGNITYANDTVQQQAYGWENLQFSTQCCGAYSPYDFTNYTQWNRYYTIQAAGVSSTVTDYNVTFPPSCCVLYANQDSYSPYSVYDFDYENCFKSTSLSENHISSQTCTDVVMNMVWNFNIISIIICAILIAIELIGIGITAAYVRKDDDDD